MIKIYSRLTLPTCINHFFGLSYALLTPNTPVPVAFVVVTSVFVHPLPTSSTSLVLRSPELHPHQPPASLSRSYLLLLPSPVSILPPLPISSCAEVPVGPLVLLLSLVPISFLCTCLSFPVLYSISHHLLVFFLRWVDFHAQRRGDREPPLPGSSSPHTRAFCPCRIHSGYPPPTSLSPGCLDPTLVGKVDGALIILKDFCFTLHQL